MGKIGFGTYRLSNKSQTHYQCLLQALNLGLSLIDTSANYTNGQSEELIGQVLKDHPNFRPIIVTKGGYIQGKSIQHVIENNLIDEIVDISENLKHSIHPKFLEDQITQSLKRLQLNTIDVYLLHNPEYYFKSAVPIKAEFYERIEKAFIHLESEVARGRIKSYGISSNNFIFPHSDPEYVSLERIISIATNIKKDHHFTHIQFPMNLIEIGALEKLGDYGELSLIEIAKFNNLITMSNRPLNAFSNNQLVRLATYENEISKLQPELAQNQFNLCMSILEKKWNEQSQHEGDAEFENINEITLIQQFREMWNKLPTLDSVDQVYLGHLFPFIAQIWGGSLTQEESDPFYKLYEYGQLYSLKLMNEKANIFRNQAINVGLIQEISSKDFALEVVETYLNYGIDYVLVGMKKPEYIDQLKSLF